MADNQLAVPLTVGAPRSRDRTPWGPADMAKAIGIMLLATLVVLVPAVAVAAALAGDGALTEDDDALSVVLSANLLLELFLGAAAVRFSVRKYRLSWAALGLRLPRRGGLWLPFVLFFGALTAAYIYFAVLAALGSKPEGNIPDAAFDTPLLVVLVGVLSLGLAPVVEELFFRGFIFGGLRGRWGLLASALASGFLFSLAHASPTVFVPFTAIGILFAWGYAYSGSLFASMVAHFLFNGISFILALAGVNT